MRKLFQKLFPKLFLRIAIVLLFACSSTAPEQSPEPKPAAEVVEQPAPEEEKQPVEEPEEEVSSVFKQFPNPDQADVIVRLQAGIPTWKEKVHHGWWECGVEVATEEQKKETALRWAYRVVQLSYEYSDDELTMNPWGVAGLVANESGFDRCAVGPFLREWGYKKGDMKKKRGGAISHSEEEIAKFLFQPKVIATVQKSGFDVGPMQELWRCNKLRECRSIFWPLHFSSVSFQRLFTMDYHFDSSVRELRRRARVNKTDRPWAYWRTGRRAEWYDKKLTRWAKMLGAKDGEI